MEIHSSARKHRVDDSDIEHAVAHALVAFDLGDDDSPRRHLILGADHSSNILEVIVLIFDDGREMAIHAMPIRSTYLDLLPDSGDIND